MQASHKEQQVAETEANGHMYATVKSPIQYIQDKEKWIVRY